MTVALPAGSTGPLAVIVARDAPPALTSGAIPSGVWPAVNVTVPVGAVALPAAGFTVAVNCTVAPNAILEGFAKSEVEVA